MAPLGKKVPNPWYILIQITKTQLNKRWNNCVL